MAPRGSARPERNEKPKSAFSIARGIKDGHRDGYTFGDIVDSNSKSDGQSHPIILHPGEKSYHPLGEIMNHQYEGGKKPNTQQLTLRYIAFLAVRLRGELLHPVHFVRILALGY